jgi:hypothetical protein
LLAAGLVTYAVLIVAVHIAIAVIIDVIVADFVHATKWIIRTVIYVITIHKFVTIIVHTVVADLVLGYTLLSITITLTTSRSRRGLAVADYIASITTIVALALACWTIGFAIRRDIGSFTQIRG